MSTVCIMRLIKHYNQLTSFPRFHFATSAQLPWLLTKKSAIDLLKCCKSMPQLMQIQAQLFTHGIHHNIDVLHKLIVSAAAANLVHAEKILSRIDRPTLFIYNVMIKAHAKSGRSRSALFLFDELRVRGLCPDNYTYPFVFKSVGSLGVVLHGEKIHGFVLKSGVMYDNYVSNSVLEMYGELGCEQSMSKLFDEMPVRELISWNVSISGFVKNSRYEDAIRVYSRMRRETSVVPDEATVVSTLSACTALKRLDLGHEIHEHVKARIGFTVRIGNALLDMYAKCGCLDIARGLFDSMPEKNVICWTSMVSAYVNSGSLDEARALFERSPTRDLILWTTLINGYVQFNKVDEAMVLFRYMQMDRIKPDKYTLVSLLTGCAQLGALEQGEWIHAYLEENGITIDAVVGTALIEMYAKCGCLEKSLDIFHRLNQKDTASWTSAICALATNGNTSMALDYFLEMTRVGIRPDDITFIGVLSSCSHGGLVEEGRRHFDSMNSVYQIEPKLEHYGCMIDLLGRAGLLDEAENMISKAPDDKGNATVAPLYGALLNACKIYDNVGMGERVAKRLVEIESRDSSCHTLVASIYAGSSRWDDVRKVRSEMSKAGLRKLPGCSVLGIDSEKSTSQCKYETMSVL